MKIALAGYGTEGKASYSYWNRDGNELTLVDEIGVIGDAPEGVKTITGEGVFGRLDDFDLIIRSPGVNPKKLPYGEKVWSATNEFFEKCPAPIIGVTGTKGKGTTSSFIASILKAAGKTVHLVGNIGVPALNELSSIKGGDVVVYELSSFQLWDARKSPHVAVVLMIEPDHLDVHDDFDDYIQAKMNITVNQNDGDVVVFNKNDEWSVKIAQVSSADTKIAYPFDLNGQKDSVRLPGKHNLDNASAAVAAVRQFTTDTAAIVSGLQNFNGLPHRLKFIATKSGVNYYDDSIATTPGSAIAALASFEAPKIIILGGKDKGADYEELIETCQRVNATVIAIGANGPVIAELCREIGATCVEEFGDMISIVRRCADIAQPDSVVILSPAASSFDMFKSYADRGDQFASAVEAL